MNSNNLIERLNEHASYLRAFKDEGQTMIERQCIAAMSEASILIQYQAAEIARLTGLAPPIERYPMTDQPKQDAIVSQRTRDLTQAILDCWFNRSEIEAKLEAYRAEIEAATIERCAEWYETKGWQMDEEEVPTAIRNLKGQTS